MKNNNAQQLSKISKTVQNVPIGPTAQFASGVSKNKPKKKKVQRDIARVLNKNSLVQERLLAMNPYLQTLLDPFNVHGARIPDLVMYPSTAISLMVRQTLTVNDQGFAGICYGLCPVQGGSSPQIAYGSIIPLFTVHGPSGFTGFPIGTVLGKTGGAGGGRPADIFGGVSPGDWIQFLSQTNANQAVSSAFDKLRLVSGGINIQYTGTALDSKGKITAAVAPRNQIRKDLNAAAPVTPITVDKIAQLPGSRTIPVNLLTGATSLYKPLDGRSLNYADLFMPVPTVPVLDDWVDILAHYVGAEMFMTCDGCTPGATFQTTAVFNFEAVPKFNTFSLVNATPSPSDPIALSHAINVTQITPSVVASSKEELGITSGSKQLNERVPDVHPAAEQPSMFDRILGGIDKFVDGSTKVIGKIAPLAKLVLSAL